MARAQWLLVTVVAQVRHPQHAPKSHQAKTLGWAPKSQLYPSSELGSSLALGCYQNPSFKFWAAGSTHLNLISAPASLTHPVYRHQCIQLPFMTLSLSNLPLTGFVPRHVAFDPPSPTTPLCSLSSFFINWISEATIKSCQLSRPYTDQSV